MLGGNVSLSLIFELIVPQSCQCPKPICRDECNDAAPLRTNSASNLIAVKKLKVVMRYAYIAVAFKGFKAKWSSG